MKSNINKPKQFSKSNCPKCNSKKQLYYTYSVNVNELREKKLKRILNVL